MLPRLLTLTLLLAGESGTATAPSRIRFEEIAEKAGLHFQLRNAAAGGFHQIELTGGGVAVIDYNNDGCADIFFTNGAAIPSLRKTGPEYYNRLFRNNCDLTFTDVTAEAGLAGEGYSMAVAVGDFDNDGFSDIFLTGVKRNTLYRNLGNGHFADVTAKAGVAGIDPKFGRMWSVSAGWLDYDNDGWLDLFVSNYVVWDAAKEPRCGSPEQQFYCHPSAYQGLPGQLFHNNRDGTFTDVSQASGIGRHIGKGMGVTFADMDGDGLTDIFVANDSVRSFLFH
ncbi:MAG: VCBS repeat-containing protein, partial [Acidobacteriota bacterium]